MPTQVEICLTVSRFSAEPRPPEDVIDLPQEMYLQLGYGWGRCRFADELASCRSHRTEDAPRLYCLAKKDGSVQNASD
jgi:hypothetical protein